MNYDEFAFFNQQLSSMLRDGIPLEGALKQLCIGMRRGALREEITALEGDLARGTPLKEALSRRKLPDFYRRMMEMGAHGNDLPGILTLLADHYNRANGAWTRLKGLLVYPVIVLVVAFGLSFVLASALTRFREVIAETSTVFSPPGPGAVGGAFMMQIWIPPVAFVILGLGLFSVAAVPGWRARARWRLPGFKEASLAELGSAMAIVLRNGMTLAEALALAETLEAHTPADKILSHWREMVETGRGKPSEWPATSRPIPPLFLWLVQQGGEDVAGGFQKAADIYYARASYRIELALYGALPVSVLLLSQMVGFQVVPVVSAMVDLMNRIGT